MPCDSDIDCHPSGGDRCVEGRCLAACDEGRCPQGTECQAVPSAQCAPSLGCDVCAPGFARTCQRGACFGQELCGRDGVFGACDAPAAASERCTGRDDDCDGRVDEEDPKLERPEGYPACRIGDAPGCSGAWVCAGAEGWRCEPTEPRAELCNGLDDDCDGEVDEDFRDEQGRYVDAAHCGGCGQDCRTAVGDLDPGPDAVACVVIAGTPRCVPRLCAPGFAPGPAPGTDGPAVACWPVEPVQCLECGRDADCGFPSHRCVLHGDDPAGGCRQGCGPDAPIPGCTGETGVRGCCPEGSTCTEHEGALVCAPDSLSCGCGPGREGATRPCLRAGGGGAECLGASECRLDGLVHRWSQCEAGEVTREVCNGLDDNCDGQVDEGFFDTRGTGAYDTDEHCGACFRSCTVLPNADGFCDPAAGPGCGILRCRTGRLAGGGLCLTDGDCGPPGSRCDPIHRQCTRACLTDGDCGGGRCVNGRCGERCTSDAACLARYGAPSVCRGGTCAVEYRYLDLDQDPANGCECPIAPIPDAPTVYPAYPQAGAPAPDRDCDGVDGDANRSLFVRAGANGNGTRARPFGTVAEAMVAFDPARHRTILVAAGTYPETLRLRGGVEVHGGYASDFGRRDVAALPTALSPPSGPALVAERLGAPARVAGLSLVAPDVGERARPGEDGRASVAVRVDDAPGLVLQNVVIRAGAGADGGAGAAGGDGAAGAGGGLGLGSAECSSASCFGERQPGGSGGRNASCAAANGTPGADSIGGQSPQPYTLPLGRNGRGGSNATYSNGSDPSFAQFCKYDCSVPASLDGGSARPGEAGQGGTGGRGCGRPEGQVGPGGWSPLDRATAGTAGRDGQGGGGGGAGGGVRNANGPGCTVGQRVGDLGATGGGGGGGGCGGSAGGGGGHGGASIGILVIRGPPPRLVGSVVELGRGGRGGAGGPGGRGGTAGPGGLGGRSGPPAWCAGNGGRGGRGGDGGGGGGGGGGCGGPSFGVAGGLGGFAPEATVFLGLGQGGGGGSGGRSPVGADGGPGADAPSREVAR